MMKRLLTFALSVGFFIWLPSAFADGSGILSLDAPSSIRQTQTPGDDNALLTLTVDNIQVRESWYVTDAANVFTINAGVLQTVKTIVAPVIHVATIYAVDRFDLLNPSYTNLTASAVITVKFESGEAEELGLDDVPRLTAVAGEAANLYTLVATGGSGGKTYTLVGGGDGHFGLGKNSGVLSLLASGQAGVYTLTVEVEDDNSSTVVALATVEVSAALMLSDAPLISVVLGAPVSLHKFIASGGIGRKTYTLAAGNESYFSVDTNSGVLSLLATAEEGVHTLTVQVIDGRNVTVDALATVEVLAALKFAAVPSFTVIASVGMNLHTLVANGGIGTPTYTILDGNNAGHFALGAASGVLSLSANAKPDNYVLRIQAKDARANTAQAMVTVGVSAALSLADASSLGGAAGTAMSLHTFAAQGGIGARTYTLLAGDAADYFSLGAESGVLSLLANASVAIYTLSVQVRDGKDNMANALATVDVRALFLASADLLYAIEGRAVSLHTFTAQGGTDVTYTLVAEADKEEYFTLGMTSGVLSVKETAPIGIYTLLVTVEDGEGNHADATAIVEVIASLSLATVPPLTVIVGRVAHTLAASGGIGIYTYTILSGDEGGHFALDAASGVLSLRVDAALGRHTLTVQVADARNNTVQAVAMVEVSAALALADAPPFTVIAGVAMSLHMFIASGGIGTPTYEIVSGDESYFSVNASSGVLSLAADAEPDTYVLRIQVTDARDNTDEAVATVGVSAALSLADAPRLTAVAGEAVSLHTFSANGGNGNNTYTLVGDDDDADYFDLDKNSGVLSLQVSAQAGVYTLTVQVADGDSGPVGAMATVEVSAALMLADAPLLSVALGAAVSLHKFIASGGIGRKTYTLAAGNKAYFSVDTNSGVLSLLAGAQEGTHMLTVQAIDEGDRKVNAVATVGVLAALTLAAAPSFTVIASVAMSLHTFIAGGGIGRKTYTLAAGDERYFSVGADSGVLSLSVDAEAGRYTLTVRVMDEHHNSVSAVVMVGVSAVLALADAPLLRTIVGEGGNLHTFAATGGIGDKTYTIAAGNEDYFILDQSSGVLSMNADVSLGIYTLSVQATDAEGNVAPALATVKVGSLLLRDVMLYAIVGREVSLHTFEADGGSGVKTYTIVAGNEDKYFTLDAGSGVLSVQGSVTVGVYTLSMQVEDADGNRSEALAVVAVEASLFLADMPSLVAFTEITLSLHTFAASGGIGAKTYTIAAAGDGADYFILNAASGVLSVANAAAGVYTLSVTVSDSRGNSAQARGTVEVFEFLSLADVSLVALARFSMEMTLTTFAAGGGYGAKRYTLIADESGYFAFDSGELSLPPNGAMLAGEYTLSVEVSDSLMPPQRATAAVVVRIAKNGIFMMGGNNGGHPRDVWFSLDGKNWSKQGDNAAWPGRSDHQVASHQGRLYLMGGDPNSPRHVWSSADGTSWSSEGNKSWLPRIRFQMVEYKGRLYAMGGIGLGGGFRKDVQSSANGKDWTPVNTNAAWAARHGHQAVVHNDRMYLLGGLTHSSVGSNGGRLNDVWSSADGNSWSFEGNANWSARYFHQAVSHQGRLYVMGGNASTRQKDVWSWAVGEENWKRETESAAWEPKSNFKAVSYDGLLYVMGGVDSSGTRKNDVWSSADGKKWTRVTADAGWAVREKLQAVVFPSPLVIWGVGASETIILALGVSAAEIYTVTAQYGLGPYTYSLTPENIGINIDGDGVLSLDDDQARTGAYAVTVQVEDKEKSHAEIIINIEIYSFALADAPPLFAYAGLAESVSLHAFTANHGAGAYTYDLVGDDSGYFTLGTASGVLSVTTNVAVGVYTLSVEVSDERAKTATAVATVAAVPILSLADAPLRSVIVGRAVSLHTFTAVGGSRIKTYNLVDAPGFFALGEGSGILSVQAVSEVGIYTVSVRVSDESGQAAAVAIVEVAASLSLADASLMAVEKKAVSLHTFAASGGIGARTYTLLAGNETGYFVLESGGVLSLSASASPGTYALTVGVMDERGNAATAVATVNIAVALSLADAPPLVVAEGYARDLHTFVASGGLGLKTYTLVAGAAYFTVGVSSGVLSVDANAPVAIYTLSVQAADADGVTAVALATVEVVSLLLLDAPMLYAIVGQEVSLHTFEADGRSEAKVFTIVDGNESMYFTLVASSGVLSVQANATVGIYTLSVAVDDEDGNRAEGLAVVAVEASLFLADMPSLVAFTEITMSLYTFAASGGIGAKTYTLSAVDGQEYFTLNATSGVLSAANAALGVYTLSVTVSDSRGNSAQARGTVQVFEFLSLADAPSLEVFARLSVTVTLHTFVDSGGYGAKRYTLIADETSYFALDAVSGELSLPSNSAMVAGTYTLLVGVSDSLSSPQRATAAATVQIARNRIFVLGGASNGLRNDVWSSADGESWRQDKANTNNNANVGWTQRQLHQAVAHNGRLYVMGGADGGKRKDVWWSVDGANWQQEADADWTGREIYQAVSYKGRIYVLGGVDDGGKRNDVWSSADGVTWSLVTGSAGWTARDRHQAVVHNGRMYVLGGQVSGGGGRNDVWSSANGSSWRFEGNADWDARYFHQAVSHAGRLYVLGGSDGSVKNDVWSSVDGRSWVEEKADNNIFWSQRYRHQSLSRDGLLYVLGGENGGGKKDVWSSADGKSWEQKTDAAWSARLFHQALVFPPNLVLSGTSETITLTLQTAAVALHTLSAQYGGGQYAYSLLPEIEGFRIGGDGVLSADGDAQGGAYALTVRVEDEEGSHAESIVNIDLRVLSLADAPPLFVIAGLSESVSLHAFTVSHGIGTYIYDLVGDESGYFTLDAASGVLSVSANVAVGVYTVSVEVSDDSSKMATAVVTVEAVPMLSLADAPLLSVVAGKALELHTFIAVGGIKAKTYNLVDAVGYFTLGASSGILSAQAASEVGIYTVSVEVSDSVGNQATAQATVGVTARLSLAGASLMAVEKKAVSLHTFVASGGIGARTYTLSVGNETGYFVLDAASGVLSLSASASAGEYTLTVGVKDERANIATAVATVNISAALSLAGVSQLLVVAEGEAKNLHTFVASGGLGVKTYTLAAGAEYFTIGAASGVLSVDANATVGIYTLSVQAADTDGNVVEALATAQVVSLLLADVMLYAIVGREVSLHTFEAGGKGVAKTYTIVAGDDDKYFTLDADSGVLSVQGGATVGVYTLSVEVTDAEDNRAEALAVVAVEASLFLADAPPLTVMAGLALSLHTFAASDGIGAKAYTITAGNEAGYFTLNAASGVLSLRATAPEGFHTLTVQAADEYNNLAEAVATVDVSAALSLAEVPLLEAVVGMTMSVHTFVASGGIGAKTYTLVVDNGSGYFAINATSGVLSVANATVGVYILSVKVSDSRGSSVQARATVQVLPPMSLADAPLLEALARLSVTVVLHTFVASDGIGSKRYTLIAAEVDYFALDAASGELLLPSNSAMLVGEYTLSVAVSDGLMPPQRATAAATVQIARNRIFVLGGNDGGLKNDVWSSADGESWRQDTSSAGWTPRQLHQAVAHNGRLYVMGGADGGKRKDVWWSVDGANWQRETDAAWPAREIHQAVSYKGRIYVLGGVDDVSKRNDVWSSADGVTWRRDKANNTPGWTARDRHQAVVHNGRLYVLGGQDSGGRNDVWSSANGSSWRFEGNADWDARYFHQAVSHAGRLYVLGGSDGSVKNDVWSSVDGRSWVEEKADNNIFWSKRYRHQSLSRDGLLYVLGGQDGGRKKDVWSSADGKTWEPETDAAWTERLFHQALVFPRNLVLSGTSETITLTMQAAVALHTVSAQYGGGQYAYSLPPEIEGFSIDGAGVLSADGDAQGGVYEITVRVDDEEGNHAETIINIELQVLALADAPPLFAVAGLSESVSLHAFTAIYGIGVPTYNLVDDLGYFTLGTASGVLSATANVAVGVYTLSVEVSDDSGKMATAVAIVEAVPILSLADAPPLTVTAGLTVSVHTFAASGGIGAKTYTLSVVNGVGYFAINATSGVLSVVNAAVGGYTLTVQVEDEGGSQAETVVQVEIVAASTAALSAVERFAWSGSGGSRNDVDLSEHGGSGREGGGVAAFSASDAVSRIGVGRGMMEVIKNIA